jgi:hypothetical protein
MTPNQKRRADKKTRKNGQSDTPADRPPSPHDATGAENALHFNPMMVIEAVRDLLTTFPTPSEEPGSAQNSASDELRVFHTMAWDMTLTEIR